MHPVLCARFDQEQNRRQDCQGIVAGWPWKKYINKSILHIKIRFEELPRYRLSYWEQQSPDQNSESIFPKQKSKHTRMLFRQLIVPISDECFGGLASVEILFVFVNVIWCDFTTKPKSKEATKPPEQYSTWVIKSLFLFAMFFFKFLTKMWVSRKSWPWPPDSVLGFCACPSDSFRTGSFRFWTAAIANTENRHHTFWKREETMSSFVNGCCLYHSYVITIKVSAEVDYSCHL